MEIKGNVHCFFEQSKEEWKDIVGFEGSYQVSNLGMVRSLAHYVKNGHGRRLVYGKILKPYKSSHGYLFVALGKKAKHRSVHRLVATAFIQNPQNLPDVNHKDENKSNNVSSNLEWCNHSYNALYGTCQERLRKYKQKAVEMMDKDTKIVIKTFESMKIAAESLGIHKEQISDVCRKKRKTAGGYIWRYAL